MKTRGLRNSDVSVQRRSFELKTRLKWRYCRKRRLVAMETRVDSALSFPLD